MSNQRFNFESANEALYLFLDGELDPLHESALFSELAVNPDLRTEMRDFLTIRGAVGQDVYAPPAHVENAVMVGAGLQNVLPIPPIAPVAGWVPSVLGFVAGGLFSAILAWFFMMGNRDTTEQLSASIFNGITGGELQAPPVEVVIPIIPDTVTIERTVERTVFVTPPVQEFKTTTPVKTDVAYNSTANPYTEVSFINPTSVAIQPPMSSSRIVTSSLHRLGIIEHAQTGTGTHHKGEVVIRSLPVASTEGLPPSFGKSEGLIPNVGFGLLVSVGSGHKVGVEMGQEMWRQEFSSTFNERPVQITQAPMLFWIGLAYKYDFPQLEIFSNLHPFIGAGFGYAMAQGPLSRLSGGLSFSPGGPVSLTAGVDVSALFYSMNSTLITSRKTGLTFGLSYGL